MNTLISTSPFGLWGTFFVLFLGSVFVLYLARNSAHTAIKSIFNLLSNASRLGAHAIDRTRDHLRNRNKEVLISQGLDQTSRDLEKEFFEVSRFVQRDLGGYPQLQRQIKEQITYIEDNYEASGEVKAGVPEWVDAVSSVAKIKTTEGAHSVNSQILEQIHHSAEKQHKEQIELQRKDAVTRHKILRSMIPYWRKMASSVDEVGNRLSEITQRSVAIDKHMQRYNELHDGEESVIRSLKVSAITQFLIALLVIVIAAGGAFFNFHLIALPMSEMVGSVQRVGGIKVADLAALVIICLEITAGIFLLEGLRITKLFPLIGSMDDKTRRTIIFASLSVLLILACTESALAFMRDQIAGDLASLRASLAGTEAPIAHAGGINEWIPLGANMILGFVLPLALTMVAIPLEYLLQTGRTVIGGLIEIVLSLFVVVLRMIAQSTKQLGKLMISLYDLYIAGPLWLEDKITQSRERKAKQESEAFYPGGEIE